MSGMKFEQKMVLLARKYGLHLTWQDIKYGYRRARFICGSYEELTALLHLLWERGGVWVDYWVCFEGEFEGYVYAMDQKDRVCFEREREKEMKRVEEWWIRYHFADAETRRMMACGEIE